MPRPAPLRLPDLGPHLPTKVALESLAKNVRGALRMGVIPDARLIELLAIAALVTTGAATKEELRVAFVIHTAPPPGRSRRTSTLSSRESR